jgi:signal transduction histidine kinase
MATTRPLLLAVVAIVASFTFALWLSQQRLNDVEADVYEVAANAEPSVIYLENARTELDRVGLCVDAYVAALTGQLPDADASRVRAEEALARMHQALAAYERLPFFPGEEALYRDAQNDVVPVERSAQTIVARAEAGNLDVARKDLLKELHPDIERLSARLKGIVEHDIAHAVKQLEAIAASRRSSWTVAVVGGASSLSLSMVSTVVASLAMWKAASQRRQIDRERGARLAAESEVRRRERFLSIVSHELRTPLTTLKLTMDALTRKPERDAPALQSTAANQVARMTGLVEDLILASQIEAGSVAISPEPTDLLELARARIHRAAISVQRSGGAMRLHGDFPVVGLWDAPALARVADKLLSNAINFGEARPIDVTVEQHEGRAHFVVHNRGIGIPADRIPSVFERFERAVPDASYPGLGLGLYIARSLVQAMGGTIHATSSPAEGTTFDVELPLEPKVVGGPEPRAS